MYANIGNIKLCQTDYAEISTLIIFPSALLFMWPFSYSVRGIHKIILRESGLLKQREKKCCFFFRLQNKPLKPTSDTIIESKSFWFPKGNVWLKFLRSKREDPDGSKIEFMLQWWTGRRKRKNLGGMNIGWRSPRLEDYRGLLTFVGVRGGQGISDMPQGGNVRGNGVRIEVLPNPILYQQKGKKWEPL